MHAAGQRAGHEQNRKGRVVDGAALLRDDAETHLRAQAVVEKRTFQQLGPGRHRARPARGREPPDDLAILVFQLQPRAVGGPDAERIGGRQYGE